MKMSDDIKYKNCFMGILSCKKYEDRRSSQDLSNVIFNYKYFIGNPTIIEPIVEGNVVTLPCEDNYENLPTKTKKMFEWILNNNQNIEYIFKTDDDIKFDFNSLSEDFNFLNSQKNDYYGNLVVTDKHESKYHFGKCETEVNERPISVGDTQYCSGGGYFISLKSAKLIIDNIDTYCNIFEDYSVGKTLYENGITPTHINLHNRSCFW
jgi:hypothetical protein